MYSYFEIIFLTFCDFKTDTKKNRCKFTKSNISFNAIVRVSITSNTEQIWDRVQMAGAIFKQIAATYFKKNVLSYGAFVKVTATCSGKAWFANSLTKSYGLAFTYPNRQFISPDAAPI